MWMSLAVLETNAEIVIHHFGLSLMYKNSLFYHRPKGKLGSNPVNNVFLLSTWHFPLMFNS